jgi:hypothetical protein
MNYREFQKRFPTENAAIAYIIEKKFPTKSTSVTGAAALAAGFIISIMTRKYFIAAIINRCFRFRFEKDELQWYV